MQIMVVINMKNPNALIAMAQVAQNANNPYAAFCEYIKYCIFINTEDTMHITEIREAVGREFGIYIPHNVLLKCLAFIVNDGVILCKDHDVKRIGSFDTEAFDQGREAYRATESALIGELVQYAANYGREWTTEHARELLIKVLDRNGLAYDIFMHEKSYDDKLRPVVSDAELDELLPDEEAIESDEDGQPLFTDNYFVGKFIEEILAGDTIKKDYLRKICEGLMLCVGTYQIPSADTTATVPQISGTAFFFDTKLLLRYIGCAGEAAVAAAQELVELIQNAGGKIYYYPQTFEEMDRAFEKAIKSLTNEYPPYDEEMRLYAARVKNSVAVLKVKKASFKDELAAKNIYLLPHESFAESDRIHYGLDHADLQQYMRNNLRWDRHVVDNDALAIWETHMRRQGDYSEYCGTNKQLPVFVTTNSRLIGIALKYREARQHVTSIREWKPNRLPIITDIRLSCRLWSPAAQSERMSLLYLTSNAVAAKRPTRKYLDSIRKLAIQLRENAPEYSGICLPSYFDDEVTNAIIEHTGGAEDQLDMGNFAGSIAELAEWKAKEEEEKTLKAEEQTRKAIVERDEYSGKLDTQTQTIIDGAVEESTNRLGIIKWALRLILWWPAIITILFAGIASVVSYYIGGWGWFSLLAIPAGLKLLEIALADEFVVKWILKAALPKLEHAFDRRIYNNLHKAELPYKDVIIQRTKEETPLWKKCADKIRK